MKAGHANVEERLSAWGEDYTTVLGVFSWGIWRPHCARKHIHLLGGRALMSILESMLGLDLGIGVCCCRASLVLLDGSLVKEQVVIVLPLVVIV